MDTDKAMIGKTVAVAGITQIADQLLDMVNELLEIAGDSSSEPSVRLVPVQPFRAEMRRYQANGEFVDLSEIEARILETLLNDQGKLVTKAQLCEVLDLDPDRQDRNVKSYVYRLKTKLNRMRHPGVMIRPIHGAGYVLSDVSGKRTAMAATG